MSIPSYVLKTVTSVFLASIALSVTPVAAHAGLVAGNKSSVSSSALPEGEQRYIVKYENGVNAEAESNSLEQKGVEVKETLSHTIKASVVVATPNEVESLKASESVSSIELDRRVSISGATSLWGLDRIDQRGGRDGQFAIGNEGAGVDIYVVDTGLNFGHAEFSGRVPDRWWGVHDGYAANDCNGHGTHVSGTAAGTTYGVAKKANIIPVRALECDGSGWSSTIMAGIDWAVARHVAGQPAVLNMSIGGFTNSSFDQTVQSAVNDGITVVAAAGNDGVDACSASPARVPSAITVAATTINDAQVSWSNYGPCVDIQAPGVSIRSAWINSATGYNTMDGTSMATPHVSGAAAVLLSRDRSMSPATVHQSIISLATTGVVGANKGATPNRLLFIPVPPSAPPSCSNLNLGDAWAGVGTHCGLQGSSQGTVATAPTEPAVPEATVVPAEESTPAPAPTPAIVEQPVPEADTAEPTAPPTAPNSADTLVPAPNTNETVPEPVSVPAQHVSVPAQKVSDDSQTQQVATPVTQYVPAAGNAGPEASVTTQEEELPKKVDEAPRVEEQSPAVIAEPITPNPSESPAPLGDATQTSQKEASVTAPEAPDSAGWLIGGGVALILLSVPLIGISIRNLKRA